MSISEQMRERAARLAARRNHGNQPPPHQQPSVSINANPTTNRRNPPQNTFPSNPTSSPSHSNSSDSSEDREAQSRRDYEYALQLQQQFAALDTHSHSNDRSDELNNSNISDYRHEVEPLPRESSVDSDVVIMDAIDGNGDHIPPQPIDSNHLVNPTQPTNPNMNTSTNSNNSNNVNHFQNFLPLSSCT